MWAGILSSLLNVALNTVFVFVFGLGIFGIAFSTVLGRLAGLVYALARAAHHERIRMSKAQDSVPGTYARPVRAIRAIALPGGAGFALLGLESLVINSILARSGDTTSTLAAWSIFDQATRLLAMPVIATGVAMLPLSARPAPWRVPGFAHAGRRALAHAGIGPTELGPLELYSCFPSAVRAQTRELGIDEARPLTVTGGMTFAGGPLNHFVLQAGVEIFGVLPHDDQIDPRVAGWNVGNVRDRPQIGEEIERLAQSDVHAHEAAADRRGDRPFERDFVADDRLEER